MVVKVHSMFDPPPTTEEVNSGELITEQAGYIPPQVQIEDMILAGERLEMARKERFDFASDDEVDDNYVDPTRSPNFDLADASMLAKDVNARIKRASVEIKVDKKEEAQEDKKDGTP